MITVNARKIRGGFEGLSSLIFPCPNADDGFDACVKQQSVSVVALVRGDSSVVTQCDRFALETFWAKRNRVSGQATLAGFAVVLSEATV